MVRTKAYIEAARGLGGFVKQFNKASKKFTIEESDKALSKIQAGTARTEKARFDALNSGGIFTGATAIGLGSTAALASIYKNEKFPDFNAEGVKEGTATVLKAGTALALIGAAGLLGARGLRGAATRVLRESADKGHFRTTATSALRNNLQNDPFHDALLPFYGSGKTGQVISVLDEMVQGAGRNVRRFMNPNSESYASQISGLSRHAKKDIDTFEMAVAKAKQEIGDLNINMEKSDYLKKAKDIWKPVRLAERAVHAKMIQDYITPSIFGQKASVPITKYAKNFVEEINFKELHSRHKHTIGPQALNNLIEVQGKGRFKKGLSVKDKDIMFFELNNKGLRQGGDVLRGIQFDNRSYNWFKKIQGKGLKIDFVENAAKEAGFKNIIRLRNGNLQIIMSPKNKPNIHWGGYAGTMVWNPEKQGQLAFMANDLGDLFGINLGKNALNTSPSRMINIPKVLKERKVSLKKQKLAPSTVKEFAEELQDVEIKGNSKGTVTSMTQEDYTNLLKTRDTYNATLEGKVPDAELIKMYAGRIGAILGSGSALYGAYPLAFSSED